jgi:carboxyl-terminal processing protease
VFIEPAQHELESESLQGKFGGIGVDLVLDAQGSVVLVPYPDSPAAKAGILEGDRLLSVQELVIDAKTSLDDIKAEIRGPEGKSVHLLVARPPNFGKYEFDIVRETILIPSTTRYIDPSEARLGVIKVNIIAASTPDEIENAVYDLQSRGATHFVLDLRDNGGGLLTTGVDTARLFLSDGVIIKQQYRGKGEETYRVEKPGPLVDIPLVVLVNHSTASAAEIIAGSLQAHKRAALIGEPTYGKNSIQLVFDLKDGSSLHVTSAHWWIPGFATPTDNVGLQPDIRLSRDGAAGDQAIIAAIQFLFHRQ